jgi:tetratricopeptide (TPR) repeat protein
MAGYRPDGKESRDLSRQAKETGEASLPSRADSAADTDGDSPVKGNLQEGIRLFRTKRMDKALRELLAVDAEKFSGEEQSELAYYLGLCYTKLGHYDEALIYLEQVVTAAFDVLRVYQCRLTLAYIYIITKRTKMAEYELKRLQSNGFESPQLYNTLAYAAWSQKLNKNAIEFYEKALEIDADNTTAMNSMGYILVDAGIDLMRGLRLCRKAVDRKPHNAAYLDSLGWAYYKSGEVVEARTWIRRALNLAPDVKEIQYHFSIVTGEAV